MELLSDSKFNLVETKELIVNNLTLYKIREDKLLNVEDSGILYVIEASNSKIKITLPEVNKGLNYSFIVSEDKEYELEFYSVNEIIGNKYLFRSDVVYKEHNINKEYSLIIKKFIKGDTFKFICDDKKYYLVEKKEVLSSINSNVYNYPINNYYKININNNNFKFLDINENELNNIIKGNTYNFIIENSNLLSPSEGEEQVIYLKTEIINNNLYPKFKYLYFDIYGNNLENIIFYKNTKYVLNCTDKSNITPNNNNSKLNKEIRINTLYNNNNIEIEFKDDEGKIINEPLLLSKNIIYKFKIIDTELISKIKLLNGINQITTNDNINYEMSFNAVEENRGRFKIDENHLIDLQIESSNNLINNKKIKIYILENIVPELVDSSDKKIEFLSNENNIYKINILDNIDIQGIRGRYNTEDNNLKELAIEKRSNILLKNNVIDLLKFKYEDKELLEDISGNYYNDLNDDEKTKLINSNIVQLNNEVYIFKLKINYNKIGSLIAYSDLKKNIVEKEINLLEEKIDNNYS